MPVLRLSTRFMLSIALAIVLLGTLWLTAAPEALPVSTYVSAGAMLAMLTAIAMKTGMSGRAAGSLATPRRDQAHLRSGR